jgi:hypothetical protein
MTTLLLLLAAASGGLAAQAAATPSPTPPINILLAKPSGEAPPQGNSLADVARRIKLRLPADKPRVLTNENVKQLAEGVELTVSAPQPRGAAVPSSSGGRGGEEAKKARWQQRYRAAVDRVKRLESEVTDLESRVAGLERDFYAASDPAYRDGVIKPAWDRALGDLAKTRSDLDDARNQPDEVLNAARRDGALPGWFRGLEEGGPVAAPAKTPQPPAPSRPAPTPTSTPRPGRPSGPS